MKPTERIPVGAGAERSAAVTRPMTVAYFHPHMPEVYGTPMMIHLMEIAAAEAIAPYLPPGWVSVGASVAVRHLAATPVGFTVTARASVVSTTRSTVTFALEAHDGVETIGSGTHVRALVEKARFEARVAKKAAARPPAGR